MNKLDDLFGIDNPKEDLPEELPESCFGEDVDCILRKNIDTANKFISIIEKEISLTNEFTPRIMEVASQLINSITAISNSMISKENNEKIVELKNKMIGLKSDDGNNKNRELIITDRETILQIMEGKKNPKTKMIENSKDIIDV